MPSWRTSSPNCQGLSLFCGSQECDLRIEMFWARYYHCYYLLIEFTINLPNQSNQCRRKCTILTLCKEHFVYQARNNMRVFHIEIVMWAKHIGWYNTGEHAAMLLVICPRYMQEGETKLSPGQTMFSLVIPKLQYILYTLFNSLAHN